MPLSVHPPAVAELKNCWSRRFLCVPFVSRESRLNNFMIGILFIYAYPSIVEAGTAQSAY
jgi:hypothetical protein